MSPIGSESSSASVASSSSTDSASTQSTGAVTGTTKISSLEDLKSLPEGEKIYDQMMLSLATSICQDSQKAQARLKEIMREARRDSQGG